jgi:mRNA-degrading endonuclease YafQ of YafQ-DinJ toxin-antitoxin module
MNMQLLQKPTFARAYKKLHADQQRAVDAAIHQIVAEPLLGAAKVGDLAGVRVHKFRIAHQLTLLAYTVTEQPPALTLLALGSHENFYRDLKRSGGDG